MRHAIPIALCVALLLLPALSPSDFYVNVATQILIAAIFALSLNLLAGYGGLISLGHAAYLGVSAYLTIWFVTRSGFSHPSAAVAAVVLTTAMSVLFGILALRATGLGFLMITLALGQILWGLAYRWVNVTGGDNGLSGLQRPRIGAAEPGTGIDGETAEHWFTLDAAFDRQIAEHAAARNAKVQALALGKGDGLIERRVASADIGWPERPGQRYANRAVPRR